MSEEKKKKVIKLKRKKITPVEEQTIKEETAEQQQADLNKEQTKKEVEIEKKESAKSSIKSKEKSKEIISEDISKPKQKITKVEEHKKEHISEKKQEAEVSGLSTEKEISGKTKPEMKKAIDNKSATNVVRRFTKYPSQIKDKGFDKVQIEDKSFKQVSKNVDRYQQDITTNEKESLTKNKYKTMILDKEKDRYDLKEKSKSKDEDIFLSRMEDDIKKKQSKTGQAAVPESIEINEIIKISELAKKMNLKSSEIIAKLLNLGVTATINDDIDSDTATLIASEFNCKVIVKSLREEAEIKEEEDKEEELTPRHPVVTIMGHVDHGKTSLLDAIRNSNIAANETGGITQHIGAYKVKTKKGEITFIDTPGHEAFTSMRARGSNVTDIVVLVVSGVEGVMPQTIEALNHAKAAKVPIIVAVNKKDLAGYNLERVKQQLAEHGLLPEDWGGDTMYIPVSAIKKQGINELLDAILLQAEILNLRANRNKRAVGYVIESKMDIGKGPVATIIVKNGSIKIGDNFIVGTTIGKVRGMFDENQNKLKIAGPSDPVEIMGFDEVPQAGDKLYVVESEEFAKNILQKRLEIKKIEENKNIKRLQMQNVMDYMSAENLENINEIKIIVKADVQGSVEAIKQSLLKLQNDQVKITIIHSGVGTVLESDVMLASATSSNENATKVIITAFRVRVDTIAKEKAELQGVTIKRFSIIYELIDYVKGLTEKMIKPTYKETVIGTAEILDIFKLKDAGKVAGAIVKEGYIKKNANVRLFRDGTQIWDGKISSLKRFKDDVLEVQAGFEFGISFQNYDNIKKGDLIECYTKEEVK